MAGFLEARPRVGYFYSGKKNADLFGDILRRMYVTDYQSVPVVVEETSPVYDAIVSMFMEDVGSLVVVREGNMQGVVSRKDLLKVAIGGGDIHQLPVHLAMTRLPNVVVIEASQSLYDAASLMVRHQIDSLPVVKDKSDPHGLQIVGRVSKTTITRAFVELGQYREI